MAPKLSTLGALVFKRKIMRHFLIDFRTLWLLGSSCVNAKLKNDPKQLSGSRFNPCGTYYRWRFSYCEVQQKIRSRIITKPKRNLLIREAGILSSSKKEVNFLLPDQITALASCSFWLTRRWALLRLMQTVFKSGSFDDEEEMIVPIRVGLISKKNLPNLIYTWYT